MRTMWDATRAGNIPATASLVAGYDNGPKSQWSPADWARFPHAVKVHISVTPFADTGHVLDVESGDARPAHAPAWAAMRRTAGLATPCVYANLATLPAVRGAFHTTRTPEPLYWIARPGAAQLEELAGATVIATQYHYAGGYDLSIVADHWPGVDPDPPEEEHMRLIKAATDPAIWLVLGDGSVHVPTPADVQRLEASGVPFTDGLSAGLVASITKLS